MRFCIEIPRKLFLSGNVFVRLAVLACAGVLFSQLFVAAARADVLESDPGAVEAYDRSAPYSQCFQGLSRYWHFLALNRSIIPE